MLTGLQPFSFLNHYPSGENGMLQLNIWCQGLFVAIIVGILVGEFYQDFQITKVEIKMPEQVPPAVARTFKIFYQL